MHSSTIPALVFPCASLHGTPASDLLAAYRDVRAAALSLRKVLDGTSPNGRDYYPQGASALGRAQEAFGNQCMAVRQIADELLALGDPEFRADGVAHGTPALMASIAEKPEVFPTIHSNGTSCEEIKAAAVAVFRAANDLEERFRTVVPNGRDYADNDLWLAAREQHANRVALIKRIGGYHLQVAVACRVSPAA